MIDDPGLAGDGPGRRPAGRWSAGPRRGCWRPAINSCPTPCMTGWNRRWTSCAAPPRVLACRSVEVEMGPSQVEFVFDPAGALDHADNMARLRAMVKQVAARQGLHTSFMCRPRVDNGASVGWHLHQSLLDLRTGRNLFAPTGPDLTPQASGWIAGLLDRAAESCVLTTPTVNGYKRYQPFQMAPDRIQWGRDNRGAMIRALMAPGDSAARIENRVAEPAANPYFVFAAQILAALSGIERGASAPPAYVPTLKRAEWGRYLAAVSEWEHREYFGLL